MKAILPPISSLFCGQQTPTIHFGERDLILPPIRFLCDNDDQSVYTPKVNDFNRMEDQDELESLSICSSSCTPLPVKGQIVNGDSTPTRRGSAAKTQPATNSEYSSPPSSSSESSSPRSPRSPLSTRSPTVAGMTERKPKNGCSCAGCKRKECKVCRFCLDKKKFGGRQILRQRCEQRKCERKGKSTAGVEKKSSSPASLSPSSSSLNSSPSSAAARLSYESKLSFPIWTVGDKEREKESKRSSDENSS